jgi:hypothetical protein
MRTTLIRATLALAIAFAAIGCSKQPASDAPLVTPSAQDAAAPPESTTMTGAIDAAGIPARYEAKFEGKQLERIVETRESGSAEYEFKGARLLRYSGAPLRAGENVELRMDLNGKVLSAMAGSQPLPQEQISEITSRAQLLRSHALAEAATRSHQ